MPIDAAAFADARAIVATSRNGLRALAASPALSAALELPIFTVGPAPRRLPAPWNFTA